MRPKKVSRAIFSFLLAFAMMISGRPLAAVHAALSADLSAAENAVQADTNRAPDLPALSAPPDGETTLATSPVLDVAVSDPDGDPLTVNFYGRPAAAVSSPGPDFTLVVLPDTQNYSLSYPANFKAQTQWVVANREALNIPFVTHEGDVINTTTKTAEWNNAVAALRVLEDPQTTGLPYGIPFGIAPGNHDMQDGGVIYNAHYGISHFAGRPYYGGHAGTNNNNHYELFSAGGMDFIILHLAYKPDAATLTWAGDRLNEFANRRAIVVSHDILETGNPASFSTNGQAIYDALKVHPNLFLMLCGHNFGEAIRTDTYNGHTVTSLLADYQSRSYGGNGWLRLLKFSPAENKIHVRTYSPTVGQYETDANSQFDLSYTMEADGYQLLGSVQVASGGHATYTWNKLDYSTAYAWYATVSDGSLTTQGPVWSFTTRWPNRPPVAGHGTVVTYEGSPAAIHLDASDEDGDPLTYSMVAPPKYGILSGTGPDLTYTPTQYYYGEDTLTFMANDGRVDSNQAVITITIYPVNNAFTEFLPLFFR